MCDLTTEVELTVELEADLELLRNNFYTTTVYREVYWKLNSQGIKYCKKCDHLYTLDSFSVHNQNKDGLYTYCRRCSADKTAEYDAADPEGKRKRGRRCHRKRYAKDPEYRAKHLAKSLKWKQENPEYMREWVQNNPEKCRVHAAKRRAIKLEATPEDVNEEHIAAIYAAVPFVEDLLGEPCHVDHIVPLAAGPEAGGTHEPSNLQIITARHNQQKNARTDWTWHNQFEQVTFVTHRQGH